MANLEKRKARLILDRKICPDCRGKVKFIHENYSTKEYSEKNNEYRKLLKCLKKERPLLGFIVGILWPNHKKYDSYFQCQKCNKKHKISYSIFKIEFDLKTAQ